MTCFFTENKNASNSTELCGLTHGQRRHSRSRLHKLAAIRVPTEHCVCREAEGWPKTLTTGEGTGTRVKATFYVQTKEKDSLFIQVCFISTVSLPRGPATPKGRRRQVLPGQLLGGSQLVFRMHLTQPTQGQSSNTVTNHSAAASL